MSYNKGEIVLFGLKNTDNVFIWKKGEMLGNNFAMCNLPDYFDDPVYYIEEILPEGSTSIRKPYESVDMGTQYLVKYEEGMDWYVGKPCADFPHPIPIGDPKMENNEFAIQIFNEALYKIINMLESIETRLSDIESTLLRINGPSITDKPFGPMKIWYGPNIENPNYIDMNKGWVYQPGPYCGVSYDPSMVIHNDDTHWPTVNQSTTTGYNPDAYMSWTTSVTK